MSRRGKRENEPTLFDLPLDGPAEAPEEPRERDERPEPERPAAAAPPRAQGAPAPEPEQVELPPAVETAPPRAPEWPAPEWSEEGVDDVGAPFEAPAPPPAARAPGSGDLAPLSVRFLGGLADLAIHLALAVLLLFGARLLGVAAGLGDWPPIAIFLLTFSFLYTVLPLAFWGQTPGMAWAGVEARAPDGQGLTVGQTVRRWLGALLTVAFLGLPVLFALVDGRSLSDRLSDSESVLAE